MGKSNSFPPAGHYNVNYGNFQTELYAQIRQEAFGGDIGQNSWLTSDEQDWFLRWLDLSPGKTLLDIACGAGGPALRIAATTGCSVIGVDVHEQAVKTANSLAAERGLAGHAEFRTTDATGPLPFSDATFDVITCYAARFFLGVAESSFFPGMIVYLTHWFRQRERSRAIACLYAAVPAASLIGSPVAGRLLGVYWRWLAGWRWLFILEGIPAIALGIVTVFYLTDWPAQARWLPEDERDWLVHELQAELQAKKKIRNYTIGEAFCDRRIRRLIVAWFLSLTGALGTIYWIPTFVKRLAGFSDRSVTTLLLVPALIGIVGMLINSWHSDKTAERHWHTAIPLLAAGLMFGLLIFARHQVPLAISCLLLGSGFLYAYYPTFWAIPTLMLSESAAAATFGLINSIGQLGGFAANYVVGFLNDRTHSLTASFGFIALVYLASASLILSLRTRNPLSASQRSEPARKMTNRNRPNIALSQKRLAAKWTDSRRRK
jgi:MFS transporter, ACS family, tartrate transporter